MFFLEKYKIYLKPGATDMRKSINTLSVVVRNHMQSKAPSGDLFVFCNRRRDILKILYWQRTRFCLWQKRLGKHRFPWPDSVVHLKGQVAIDTSSLPPEVQSYISTLEKRKATLEEQKESYRNRYESAKKQAEAEKRRAEKYRRQLFARKSEKLRLEPDAQARFFTKQRKLLLKLIRLQQRPTDASERKHVKNGRRPYPRGYLSLKSGTTFLLKKTLPLL